MLVLRVYPSQQHDPHRFTEGGNASVQVAPCDKSMARLLFLGLAHNHITIRSSLLCRHSDKAIAKTSSATNNGNVMRIESVDESSSIPMEMATFGCADRSAEKGKSNDICVHENIPVHFLSRGS